MTLRLVLLFIALATGHAAAARMLVTNANGYTLDAAGGVTRFAALLVGDDGRVVATFATGAALPTADRVVDAGGRTLLPGLIDAHGHVMELGERALAVDLSDTLSLDAALARVKANADADPAARWIVGSGWNQERWGLGRFPTAAELDRAVPNRPVWLVRVDGHAGWANTAAIRLAGVTGATADPSGGRFERNPDRTAAGVFVDSARGLIEAVVPDRTPAESMRVLDKALAIMASVGLTQVGDMGVSAGTWRLYKYYDARHRLTARIDAMAAGLDALAAIAPHGPVRWSGDGRLALNGVKLYADGALGSRGAWLKADYADAPGQRGLQFHPDAELRAQVAQAAAGGFDISVHAIGDAANAQVLDAFAALPPGTCQRLRCRDEHAQIVDVADLPRFAALGVIASMQPTHATSDKGMAEARLGDARLAGAYAWATLRKSGARFAGGSDFPVEPPNPFYGLHAAVTRQDRGGQPVGGWRSAEVLSFAQAFAAFTSGAAHADRAPDTGTLAGGKWADFILVDRDPFVTPPGDLWKIVVDETWVGGQRVFKRPDRPPLP